MKSNVYYMYYYWDNRNEKGCYIQLGRDFEYCLDEVEMSGGRRIHNLSVKDYYNEN